MHKRGLTQAEIDLTQPENRSNSNFRTSTCLALPKKCRKKPPGNNISIAFYPFPAKVSDVGHRHQVKIWQRNRNVNSNPEDNGSTL